MRSYEALSGSTEEKLKHAITQRLVQTGWRDRVKDQCFSILASKRGRQISIEQLISEVTPFARSIVPATVKSELLESVKDASRAVQDSKNYKMFCSHCSQNDQRLPGSKKRDFTVRPFIGIFDE